MDVFFHGKPKNGIKILKLLGKEGLGLKKHLKIAFLSVNSFVKLPLSISRVFNGEIRGKCDSCSFRIIFWQSTQSLSWMCLEKFKNS